MYTLPDIYMYLNQCGEMCKSYEIEFFSDFTVSKVINSSLKYPVIELFRNVMNMKIASSK